MTKTRSLVIEAIDYLTYFALFYGIFATVLYTISSDIMDLLRAGFMIMPVIINFLLRRVSANMGKMLMLHSILPVILIIILPANPTTIAFIIMSVLLALHSVFFSYRKRHTDGVSFMLPCAAILIALSLLGPNRSWQFMLMYSTLMIVAIIGRILLVRMVKMDISLDAMHLSYKQPIEKIVTFDYKLTAGLVVAMVGMVLVIYFMIFAPIANAILRYEPALPTIESESDRSVPDDTRLAPGDREYSLLDGEDRRPSPLWELLTNIFFGIVSIGIILAILYVVYRLLMVLLRLRPRKRGAYSSSANTEDEREFIRPKARNRNRIRSAFAELHPIRRLFKETAKKHIKMGVSIKQSDTPTDIKNRIRSEDISSLTEEYAEVRYRKN